jgi:hypothetical protein
MVTIDWSFVGVVLTSLGGIGTVAWGAFMLPSILRHIKAVQSVTADVVPVKTVTLDVKSDSPLAVVPRGADQIAPPGAVEWVLDICSAMSMAEPGTILESLKVGESRDQARTRRIAELEDVMTETKGGEV